MRFGVHFGILLGCLVATTGGQARVLSKFETATAALVEKAVGGSLTKHDLIGVHVVIRGKLPKAVSDQAIPIDFTGCRTLGVLQRTKPYVAPKDAGTLAGTEYTVVDTAFDCSQRHENPYFARLSAMFKADRIETLVFSAGLF